MDRISAIRNVEDALAEFEAGEIDLAAMEQRVVGVLRTYATEFDGDDRSAYRAHGDERADGMVVVAADRPEARDRIEGLLGEDLEFELDEVG